MTPSMWRVLEIAFFAGLIALLYSWHRRCTGLRSSLAQADHLVGTLREQCRQAGVQEQARQRALFNSMADGILVLDAIRLSKPETRR